MTQAMKHKLIRGLRRLRPLGSNRRGNILARQRGTKWKPGNNVGRGKDDTLFALIEGFVKFENKGQKGKFISVYAERPADQVAETAAETV